MFVMRPAFAINISKTHRYIAYKITIILRYIQAKPTHILNTNKSEYKHAIKYEIITRRYI